MEAGKQVPVESAGHIVRIGGRCIRGRALLSSSDIQPDGCKRIQGHPGNSSVVWLGVLLTLRVKQAVTPFSFSGGLEVAKLLVTAGVSASIAVRYALGTFGGADGPSHWT